MSSLESATAKLSNDTRARLRISAAPALDGLTHPADLKNATLLRHPLLPWRPWIKAAGLDWPEPESGALYEDAMLMYEAAAGSRATAGGADVYSVAATGGAPCITPRSSPTNGFHTMKDE